MILFKIITIGFFIIALIGSFYSVKFVRKYLETTTSNAPIHVVKREQGGGTQPKGIGARDIALFLSKDGKMISHSKVANLLKIEAKVSPKLIEQAESSKNQWDAKTNISPSILSEVAQVKNFKDQELIVKKAQEEEIGHKKVREIVSSFENAPEEIKEKVRKGEIELTDVPIENLKEDIKKKIEEQKERDGGKIKVIYYKQFQRDAGNKVGDTNDKILNTCLFLNGLEKSGVLYELDWKTMLKIIESGTKYGKDYTKFMDKILGKII